jgi:VWFA-related protein
MNSNLHGEHLSRKRSKTPEEIKSGIEGLFMKHGTILPVVLLGLFFAAPGIATSQPASAAPEASSVATAAESSAMTLDVVVTGKSGTPVAGMQPEDFKLLDNNVPESIASIKAAGGMSAKADPPVEVILLVDGLNPGFGGVAYERQELMAYFQKNGGKLALPTSLAIVNPLGIQVQNKPTRDGQKLMQFLDSGAPGLRGEVRNDPWLQTQLSLDDLDYLAIQASKRPGRKLLIWLSPGWRIGLNPTPWHYWRNKKDQLQLYEYIAYVSTELRRARITLSAINPLGVGHGEFLYGDYVKGVSKVEDADYSHLLLPVLATQSGGQVLFGSNDLGSQIERCIADTQAYYQLTFTPPSAAHANEYHSIAVLVDKPGLKARTRTGYYGQPTFSGAPIPPDPHLQGSPTGGGKPE